MLTILLALGSASLYGLSDFFGGLASRWTSVWAVAVVTQCTAVVAIGAVALISGGGASPGDLAWGALAGVGTGVGTAFLYRGLASGRMGVVAPLSAVGAALLPVIVGVASGERPALLTWVGIVAAIPAIWLVSTSADPVDVGGERRRLGEGVPDGLLAGVGFGLMFASLGQVDEAAGLWPVAAAEVTSVGTVVLLATLMGRAWWPRERSAGWGILVGALAAAATVLFLLASQSGLLAVAAVLASLYPVFTVLLAATVLRERIHGPQGIGLLLAGTAVALVALR